MVRTQAQWQQRLNTGRALLQRLERRGASGLRSGKEFPAGGETNVVTAVGDSTSGVSGAVAAVERRDNQARAANTENAESPPAGGGCRVRKVFLPRCCSLRPLVHMSADCRERALAFAMVSSVCVSERERAMYVYASIHVYV